MYIYLFRSSRQTKVWDNWWRMLLQGSMRHHLSHTFVDHTFVEQTGEDLQKYETHDDACFFKRSMRHHLQTYNSMRQMMTHASSTKHASSFVSYFCWADLQTWDKWWRMHEACVIMCLILLLIILLLSRLTRADLQKYETDDDACFFNEACVIICLIRLLRR